MKCKKEILEIAKFETNENVLWYNSRRKGLGKKFSF